MPAIVESHPHDAPALTAIAHSAKAHWGYPKEWILAWRDDLTLDQAYIQSHDVHAIRDQDRLLGFCSLVMLDSVEHRWELDHLWVIPEAMGRGLGRALFEHAIAHAGRRGARRLRILSETVGRVDATVCGVERWLPEMEMVIQDALPTSQRPAGAP